MKSYYPSLRISRATGALCLFALVYFAFGFQVSLVNAFCGALCSKETQRREHSFSRIGRLFLSLDEQSHLICHPSLKGRRDVLSTAAGTLSTAVVGACPHFGVPLRIAEAATLVPSVMLGSLAVSRTIQGYWQLAGGHGRVSEEDAIGNMEAHYRAGITALDTADIYGPSEQIMGKFIKHRLGPVPCTKFCCFRYLHEIDKAEVRTRIKKQCERLQVDKLPLVAFFWSDYNVKRYVDVALMLTELKEEGLIQEIGATNFDLKRLKELQRAGVPIVSHQVQLSAMDQRPVQSGMTQWCHENRIKLIAFGTIASGILSDRYLGKPLPNKDQRNTASMRMYSATASRFGDWKLVQDLLQTMRNIADDVRSSGRCVDANISNVAQRYVLDTPAVASVLIGVRSKEHITENVRTHAFQLKENERMTIDDVVRRRQGPRGDVWDLERGFI